ncbi:MAG: beta-ketoacyl synthase chain length factor [Bacteroidia bacterium]
MEVYINALSCISHHNTIDDDFFFEDIPSIPTSNSLQVTAPVYKDYIPANTIRRTSHILKMGISAGLMCLRKTGKEQTDAIVVGTAMGCFEDTDKFLRSIGDNNESMLTPTSFIQSTHNTVAGQLALLTKCHGYNFTYVHQNLSFEYALLDAMLLLKDGEAETVLVGGVDELIPPLFELFDRAGHIKKTENNNEPIWKSKSKGFIAGEGSAFFSIGNKSTDSSIAKIKGVKAIQKLNTEGELSDHCTAFLNELNLKKEDISLVLNGASGDSEKDKRILNFTDTLNLPTAYFKHLCGEYFTSSGFALWLATNILKKQRVPDSIIPTKFSGALKNILIVNHYQDQHYSFICVSAC